MSSAEYSLIFLSIVISYIVTGAMAGWGKQIKNFNAANFSLSYLLWTIILFIYLLFIWFWTYSFHLDYLEQYFWVCLILIRPLLISFCFEILIPTRHENLNYAIIFLETKKKFFILLSILWVFEIFLILIMKLDLFAPRGVLVIINLPISISLIFIKNKFYIKALTIVAFILMVFTLVYQVWIQ